MKAKGISLWAQALGAFLIVSTVLCKAFGIISESLLIKDVVYAAGAVVCIFSPVYVNIIIDKVREFNGSKMLPVDPPVRPDPIRVPKASDESSDSKTKFKPGKLRGLQKES
jgi:hypothetical protein